MFGVFQEIACKSQVCPEIDSVLEESVKYSGRKYTVEIGTVDFFCGKINCGSRGVEGGSSPFG